MAIIIRTSISAVLHSKAAVLAVLFVAILTASGVVVLLPLADATGSMKALVIIALCFPGIGILLSIVTLVSLIRKTRRPVLIINDDVIINGEIAFPVTELLEVHIYGHGRTSFATLVTHNRKDTITFPEGAIPTPSQFAALVRCHYPAVTVYWLGSI